LACQVNAQSFLTNGLVAYYPFNGNANDASGNGNNGFAENTYATTNRFGQPKSALGFSGNSWVYVPYASSLCTSSYSVSMMFNSGGDYCNLCLLRSGSVSTGYEITERDFCQNFGFSDWNGGSDDAKCVTPITNWLQNQWYNLIFTRTETNGQLYLNGVLIASATNSPQYTPLQNWPLYIGANCNDPATSDPTVPPPAGYFTGVIYDVRLYNRGLSPAEVQQVYAYESQPIVSLRKAVSPSFSNLFLGTNYQLQVSTDLNTWTNNGSSFTPTNTAMAYPQYFDVDNWGQLFFRLQVAP